MDDLDPAIQAALKRRGYVHFDEPLPPTACKRLVTCPQSVAKHSFYPFLRLDIIRPRIKRVGKGKLRKSAKVREIRYAAHADSAIYAYYGAKLSTAYESVLASNGLADCVIAFRSLGKSNIEFANEAFQWIAANRPCVAIGLDVTDFFGSLDHQLLKEQWASLIGSQRLPVDHFQVFRSLTTHSTVELIRARKTLGVSRTALSRSRRLCSPEMFRDVVRQSGLISVNNTGKGIPQGSPMSAVLSNLYMLSFDLAVANRVREIGGLYRRYCDDILIVVPTGHETNIQSWASSELAKLRLNVQPAKTLICHFQPNSVQAPLSYLGLTYDGLNIRLRNSAIAKYYKKMRDGVAGLKFAGRRDGSTSLIEQRRRLLLNRYTEHASPDTRSFLSYVSRAQAHTRSPAIRRQLRLHMKRFRAALKS